MGLAVMVMIRLSDWGMHPLTKKYKDVCATHVFDVSIYKVLIRSAHSTECTGKISSIHCLHPQQTLNTSSDLVRSSFPMNRNIPPREFLRLDGGTQDAESRCWYWSSSNMCRGPVTRSVHMSRGGEMFEF